MKTPRDYQTEAVTIVHSELKNGITKQLLTFATGMGKTFTAALIILSFIDHFRKGLPKVLWITHREELIEQSAIAVLCELFPEYADDFRSLISDQDEDAESSAVLLALRNRTLMASETEIALQERLGLIKRDLQIIDRSFVVASVQTLVNRIKNIDPEEFDIVIVDECHYAVAKTWETSINHFDAKLRLGLTATPERLDGVSLNSLFDKIVYERDIEYGIKKEYLCELDAIRIKTNIDLDKVRTTGGDLNQKDLKIIDCDDRNNQIVDAYMQYAMGRQAIAFAYGIEHAKNLTRAFTNRGISAEFVVSDIHECPDRRARIRRFKNKETDILVNIDILTAGFDYPPTGCIIQARPTKSLAMYLQQIGRGTRNKPDDFRARFGNNCIILDITDNTKRHHLINTWTLDKGKSPDKMVFITAEKREKLIAKFAEKRRLEHDQKKNERVNLMKVPPKRKIDLNDPRLKVPATEKQLLYLKSKNFDVENTFYTKGMAMEIIGGLDASDAQKHALKFHGFDVPDDLTMDQARECFNIIDERNQKAEAAKEGASFGRLKDLK